MVDEFGSGIVVGGRVMEVGNDGGGESESYTWVNTVNWESKH